MDEHAYIRSVHRQLDKLTSDVYKWKINARFVQGVPDAWYSGPGGDVWVEYKYSNREPVRKFTPGLSAHQRKWLRDRNQEGRMVGLVFGCPLGSIILTKDPDFDGQIAVPSEWLSAKRVAEWITARTLCT